MGLALPKGALVGPAGARLSSSPLPLFLCLWVPLGRHSRPEGWDGLGEWGGVVHSNKIRSTIWPRLLRGPGVLQADRAWMRRHTVWVIAAEPRTEINQHPVVEHWAQGRKFFSRSRMELAEEVWGDPRPFAQPPSLSVFSGQHRWGLQYRDPGGQPERS